MKCSVVTVYQSENCGSFLQAYALFRQMTQMGYDVCFEEHNFYDHLNSDINYATAMVKCMLKMRFSAMKLLRQRRKIYQKEAVKLLPIKKTAKSADCYILGSDTVWDLAISYFRNHTSFFWGTEFGNKRIISYAPSVGFAQKEDAKKCDFIRDALSNMSAVSVRDQHSKELLQPYCDEEIQIVCDPTYLLSRSEYDAIAKPTDLENFLFIYYYGKMPTDYQKAIQDYSKARGLKTVTFGTANPWCDVSLVYDPLLFLSIYDKAACIITNTFHGTVFATIYEKRFAVTKNDKPKVLDVLKMCDMSDKMTNKAEDISNILNSDFDYAVTRQNIRQKREKGLQYLKQAIEG